MKSLRDEILLRRVILSERSEDFIKQAERDNPSDATNQRVISLLVLWLCPSESCADALTDKLCAFLETHRAIDDEVVISSIAPGETGELFIVKCACVVRALQVALCLLGSIAQLNPPSSE